MNTELFLLPLFDWRSAVCSTHGPEKPTTRFVLLTLALHMSVKGDSCFPSIDLLAEESGLSRRAVIEHLQIAEQTGWLAKKDRSVRSGQGWRRVEYFGLIPRGIEAALRAPKGKVVQEDHQLEGGDRGAEGGDPDRKKVVQEDHPSTSVNSSMNKRDTTPPQQGEGGPQLELTGSPPPKPVTPTAAAWQAYKAAIKKKYGVEPPMSPKAMGQLSQLVARVGAENAVAVVQHYLGTAKPYYQAQKHTIDTLLKDCHSLYMEMKAQHGERGAPQVNSTVHFVKPDNTDRKMGDVPAGEAANAEALAKKWAHDYSRLIGEKGFVHVAIVTGQNRKVFSIAELRGRG